MVNVMLVVLVYSLTLNVCEVMGIQYMQTITKEEDLDLERQLKVLNKPAVKTIKTFDGDLYDCVDIYKQPSLDHPALKNHNIQMKPDSTAQKRMHETLSRRKYTPAAEIKEANSSNKCPKGTVPIPRTTKEDLVRSKSLRERHTGYIFAGMHTKSDAFNKILGNTATMSLWHPSVSLNDEYTGAGITVLSGQDPHLIYIEAGWTVNPTIGSDNRTRLYTRWTADNFHTTGCYNLMCPGFIYVKPTSALDNVFDEVSRINGELKDTQVLLISDKSGNWWLSVVVDDVVHSIGYWPRELFTSLGDGASEAKWMGFVLVRENDFIDPFPEMGTGSVFKGDYGMSAYIAQIQILDPTGVPVTPNSTTVEFFQFDWCYYAAHEAYTEDYGFHFLYGGPYIQFC